MHFPIFFPINNFPNCFNGSCLFKTLPLRRLILVILILLENHLFLLVSKSVALNYAQYYCALCICRNVSFLTFPFLLQTHEMFSHAVFSKKQLFNLLFSTTINFSVSFQIIFLSFSLVSFCLK